MPIEMRNKPRTKFRQRCDMGIREIPALVGNKGEVTHCMARGPWRRLPRQARRDAEKVGFWEVEPGIMVCPKHRPKKEPSEFMQDMRRRRLAREAKREAREEGRKSAE